MRLKLNDTPDQIELVKAIGSKDPSVSREAMEALAAFVGPVISTVLNQLGTVPMIYKPMPFSEDDSPSIPLDLYYDKEVGYISTWSQSWAGGMPTNMIEGIKEMKISTFRLDSAIGWNKKYARKSRLDVVSKALERLAQEILVKEERNGWAVLLRAIAEASTGGTSHITTTNTADVFQMEDLNQLMVRIKRINQSFAAGTPSDFSSKGLTDLFVSPEIKGQIRAFAYQPMNTRVGPTVPGSTLSSYTSTTAVPLPDAVRERIFNSAGTSELYGVGITELNELGTGQKYNVLFGEFATGNIAHGTTFNTSTDELIIGLDLSRDAFFSPVEKDANGGTLTVLPDDQWVSRSDKAGLYCFEEKGFVDIDSRAALGITV